MQLTFRINLNEEIQLKVWKTISKQRKYSSKQLKYETAHQLLIQTKKLSQNTKLRICAKITWNSKQKELIQSKIKMIILSYQLTYYESEALKIDNIVVVLLFNALRKKMLLKSWSWTAPPWVRIDPVTSPVTPCCKLLESLWEESSVIKFQLAFKKQTGNKTNKVLIIYVLIISPCQIIFLSSCYRCVDRVDRVDWKRNHQSVMGRFWHPMYVTRSSCGVRKGSISQGAPKRVVLAAFWELS